MNIHENFVSTKEAAQILKVTPARIGFLCRQGRFKGAEKIGAVVIIPREAVLNHVRLQPGAKPRGYKDKSFLAEFTNKADNLQGEKIL